MSRDISIGKNRRRLDQLGYAITSATNPDRVINSHWSLAGRRAVLSALSGEPAAIFTHPTPENSPELKDGDHAQRRIALLIVTAYLQSDSKQLKSVMAVLERYKLTSGPYRVDDFGNRTYPLAFNGTEMFGEFAARLAFPDDDGTVIFQGAAKNSRFEQRRVGEHGAYQSVPLDVDQSYVLPLEGDWKQGHVLDVPRRNLPELLPGDVREIIAEVERARWGARPAATAKEAA